MGGDMTKIAMEAARMMDMLPDDDKRFAYEFIKKLVKAWTLISRRSPQKKPDGSRWQRTAALSMKPTLTGTISKHPLQVN